MSIFIAYNCPECGAKDFEVRDCYACGGRIDKPVVCGVDKAEGFPNVVRDHMTPHLDAAAGQVIRSRSERNRVYARKGLAPKSYDEYRRQHPTNTPTGRNRAVSYGGQTIRRSTAEKKGTRHE